MCREGFRGGSKSWARCFSGLRLHKGLGQVTPRAAGCRRGCVVSDAGTCDTRDPAPPEALIRRQSSDGKRVGPLLHGSRSNVAVADQGLGCSTLSYMNYGPDHSPHRARKVYVTCHPMGGANRTRCGVDPCSEKIGYAGFACLVKVHISYAQWMARVKR